MCFLVDRVQEYKSPSTCIFFFIFDCLWRKYISWGTGVHLVGHESIYCQWRKYILSYTGFKVHLYLCMKAYTRELKKLLKNQIAGVTEVEIMYS